MKMNMCDISIMYYNLASSLYRFISMYVDKICIYIESDDKALNIHENFMKLLKR